MMQMPVVVARQQQLAMPTLTGNTMSMTISIVDKLLVLYTSLGIDMIYLI